MTDNRSIFADDWRESLQEHYKDVVRRNDTLTEKTLVGVLHDVGFTDDELRQLTIQATMRTEDVADDFVPDLDIHSHDHTHSEPDESKVFTGITLEAPDEDDIAPVDESDITAGEPIAQDEAVVTAGADGNITVIEKKPDENTDSEELNDEHVEKTEESPEDDADTPMQISMF